MSVPRKVGGVAFSLVATLTLITTVLLSSLKQYEPHIKSSYPIDTATYQIFKQDIDHYDSSVSPITWQNFRDYVRLIDFANSTALFNTIYAALRQGPSDIHPLGLSYFPAVIPKGTLLYHTGTGEIPNSFEWLAMDAEFSYSFAMRFPKYGRNATKKPGMFGPMGPGGHSNLSSSEDFPKRNHTRSFNGRRHFLTFRATRDLNKLLYLDGASAAKTTTGEMDTQKLLSNVISHNLDSGTNSSEFRAERIYAERICRWGKPFGLDGYIRVEIGFELVLCDFNNGSVELVSNLTLPDIQKVFDLPPPANISIENGWPLDKDSGTIIEDLLTDEQREIMDNEDRIERMLQQYSSMIGFDWLRAGAIHNKGEPRIQLDYRYMVTGINRTTGNINPNARRLLNENMTFDQQLAMANELESILQQLNYFEPTESNNWQNMVDEIIDKFAFILRAMNKLLNSDQEDITPQRRALETTRYTLNFILRFSGQNPLDTPGSNEFGFGKEFAVYQYTRPSLTLETDADYLVWSAIVNVVTKIVDTIYDVNDLLLPIVKESINFINTTEEASTEYIVALEKAKSKVNKLVEDLHWIALDGYDCDKKCSWDEICYTPSWGPSPLRDWSSPASRSHGFGKHWDESVGRQVIDTDLRCISADDLLVPSP